MHVIIYTSRVHFQQVITNEAVLDMVRNTLQEEDLQQQLKEAIFEPKMTRSKVKEVLQTNMVRCGECHC